MSKKKKRVCPLIISAHHLPFTSQPTTIWLPSPHPIETIVVKMVAAVFQHAQCPDLFLGLLLGELSAALDTGVQGQAPHARAG